MGERAPEILYSTHIGIYSLLIRDGSRTGGIYSFLNCGRLLIRDGSHTGGIYSFLIVVDY